MYLGAAANEKSEDEMKLEEWLASLESMQLKRSELNLLIMDYLISEGFKEAAERFKIEAGIEMSKVGDEGLSFESAEDIDKRIEIRAAIEDGQVSRALKLINDYYPELIDNNRHLYFKLQVRMDITCFYISILTNISIFSNSN